LPLAAPLSDCRCCFRVPGVLPESRSWRASAAPLDETQHCGRQGAPAFGEPAVASQEERHGFWSRPVPHDPTPAGTARNQRQLASPPDQESPCNHSQSFTSRSLTENRGVGGSTPPLAMSTCKSGCFRASPRSGRPFLGIMVLPVRGTCGRAEQAVGHLRRLLRTPANSRPSDSSRARTDVPPPRALRERRGVSAALPLFVLCASDRRSPRRRLL
jgi:hypothetical protein